MHNAAMMVDIILFVIIKLTHLAMHNAAMMVSMVDAELHSTAQHSTAPPAV